MFDLVFLFYYLVLYEQLKSKVLFRYHDFLLEVRQISNKAGTIIYATPCVKVTQMSPIFPFCALSEVIIK